MTPHRQGRAEQAQDVDPASADDGALRAGRDCPLIAFECSRPLIVLTNDDGVASPGLVALRTALTPLGEVQIVAPDQNRSGAARSITMRSPLWVEEVELSDGSLAYSTDGTPVDCVRMAALGLLDRSPDLIVSGINLGGNLGDDITYSGTVAAALEGIMLDIPAIAISAEDYRPGYDLSVPGKVAYRLVALALENGFPAKTLLNVNCPDRTWETLGGVRLTTLGKRIYGDKAEYRESKGNRHGYHIYNDDLSYQQETGSDFEAIAEGWVSVTPLHFDLMSHEAFDRLRGWEDALRSWKTD
jgi:5'-nucleotidase